MARTVNWGILSTARIGTEKVIPALQKSDLTRVVAIASRDETRGRQAAAKLGIPRVHDSYEALLADPDVEAIYNPLPNHLHVPLTIRAMEAGKHVLCEKPIALTAAEAEQLVAARERTGRQVAEAFMVRHHPQWQRTRELVRSGRIGEARAVQTFFSFFTDDPDNIRNKPEMGGGALFDVGCYAIVTSRFVFDAEPERVVGLFDRDPAFGVDRVTSGLAAYPGGRQLTFTAATQLTLYQRVVVVGTKGRIEIEVPFNQPPTRPARIRIDDGRDLYGGGAEVEEFPLVDQYTRQGDAFSRAILGEAPLAYPIEDAIQNMRIIEAFFRSGETGRWETP